MQGTLFSSLLSFMVVLTILSGCAASSEPCDKLLKRVCAAGGDSLCEQVRQQHASQADDAAAAKRCESLLEDPQRLGEMLDGLRAASLLNVSLSGDAKEGAETEGAEEAKGPVPTTAAPEVKPAAPAATASPDGS